MKGELYGMKGIASLTSIALPKGATVLIRVDFNVVFREGKVENNFRITQTLPTIRYALKRGYRVILLTHLEKDGIHPPLRALVPHLRHWKDLRLLQYISGTDRRRIRKQIDKKTSALMLLENTRRFEGEEKNSAEIAEFFASLGGAFVHDAFAVAHRTHASTHRITEFLPSYSGFLFEREMQKLSELFRPPRPFLLVLGGKKVSTKIPLLRKFFHKADHIFIGGAAANTLLAARGFSVGASFVERRARHSLTRAMITSSRVILPEDVVVRRGKLSRMVAADRIEAHDAIVDIGPLSIRALRAAVGQSKCVLWNGPLGVVEEGFDTGTIALANALRRADVKTVIGGGDTVAFLGKKKLLRGFDFVSTGGGAMLDFLAKGALPAITALKKSKKKFRI